VLIQAGRFRYGHLSPTVPGQPSSWPFQAKGRSILYHAPAIPDPENKTALLSYIAYCRFRDIAQAFGPKKHLFTVRMRHLRQFW
jgi:hypothetical protein